MEAQPPYLFVYGTLMRGFDNPFAARLRAHSAFIAEGFFSGKLYRISWYPGALYEPKGTLKVHGEIYQLLDFQKLIRELDEYEDVKEIESESLYLRRQVPVQTESGDVFLCWTYLYNQSLAEATPLPDGRFTV
ncbi:gamma-glutamylcyclotransferase family protein [Salmonirosea aquatica]|uniref:Gamma-glutamylcyclotransferase n=1 Tax=Salmonirosea aquatica TaxID=2654236 RepID=A0A7C9F3Y2_9BACT|nr:gamma-glutamylcyclotransferase [Cytophagaceae bacterium SJW1-29]